MTFSLKKKYYTVRIFQSLSRNLVYAFNEDHSGVKKKTKSNACMKIFDLPKILQDQHFFPYVLSGILAGCRRYYTYIHIVHISRATDIQNHLKTCFFL